MTDISENDIQVVRKWLDGGCPSWGVPVDQIRKLCSAIATLEAQLAARTGGVKVKALEWEETHSRRSDEDPTTEWNGGFEADSALGYYEISMGIGSDAYYWAVTNPLGDNVGSDFEDPSYAKAAAQQDYERRILAALEPAARDANTVASHETTNVEDKPAAPWPVSYANSTAPGRPFESAATEGQQPVASGVSGVGWTPLTEKNDVMTCPLPADETVVEVMLKDGTVCRALYSCNIMETGDWDFVPVAANGEPEDDTDSIASDVVAWRHALQPARPTERTMTEADLDDVEKLFLAARVEADKAMRKFPQPNYVISKIAEEAGEVVKAAIHCAEGRETSENVVAEIRQAMAMLIRLYIEGDQVHGLPPLKAAMEAGR